MEDTARLRLWRWIECGKTRDEAGIVEPKGQRLAGGGRCFGAAGRTTTQAAQWAGVAIGISGSGVGRMRLCDLLGRLAARMLFSSAGDDRAARAALAAGHSLARQHERCTERGEQREPRCQTVTLHGR